MGEDKIMCSQFTDLDDEEEEVLSFCDIPLYSDSSSDSKSIKSKLITSSLEEEGLFEFFKFGNPDSRFQSESFIFCGRLIPYGESPSQKKAKNSSRMSSMKTCRWYKIMFGSMRLSAEMDMGDIRSRQGRRHKKPKTMFGMYEDDVRRRKIDRKSSADRLMGLVRSLSCKGHCSTSIVETSIQ